MEPGHSPTSNTEMPTTEKREWIHLQPQQVNECRKREQYPPATIAQPLTQWQRQQEAPQQLSKSPFLWIRTDR